MKILVTGAAGYIGTFFLRRLIKENSVEKIIGVDLLPQPKNVSSDKIVWVRHGLAKNGLQENVLKYGVPDVVVHLAFKIRSPYCKEKETERNNLNASRNVFEFCFKNNVLKLIYTSSVAAYGAKEENIGKLLRESEPLQENKSPYGFHKRLAEELLQNLYAEMKPKTDVAVLRLNSVTGHYGQGLKSKFGLVTFLKKLLPFVIETHPAWARQFIHEKDVEEILWTLTGSAPNAGQIEIYNCAPPSFLTAKDIAKLLGKKTIKVPQWLVQPLFWLAWNLTLGKVPTHPDSADGLIYPINVDGSKIQSIGFRYKFTPGDALLEKS